MHFSLLLFLPIFLTAIANPVDQFDSNPSSSDPSRDTVELENSAFVDPSYTSNDVLAESSENSAAEDPLYAFNNVPAKSSDNSADPDPFYAFSQVPADSSDNSDGSTIAYCDPESNSDSSLVPDSSADSSPDQQAWNNLNVLKIRQTGIVDNIMQFVNPKPKTPTTPSGGTCRNRASPQVDPPVGQPSRQEKYYAPGYPDWAKKCEESNYFHALCCTGVPRKANKRSVKIARNGFHGAYNVGGCVWIITVKDFKDPRCDDPTQRWCCGSPPQTHNPDPYEGRNCQDPNDVRPKRR